MELSDVDNTAEHTADLIPLDAVKLVLDSNFIKSLIKESEVINEHDFSSVLSGINFSSKGITSTNGKRLMHHPFALAELPYDLTIPVLYWMGNLPESEAILRVWKGEKDGIYFSITIGKWSWTACA